MGKSNRRRRATKKRKRARPTGPTPVGRAASRPRYEEPPPDHSDYRPAQLFVSAAFAHGRGFAEDRDGFLDALAARPAAEVLPDVEARLTADVSRLWDAGWQPADLHRYMAKRSDDEGVRLLREVLAIGAREYEDLGRRVAPGWMAQLDAMDAPIAQADLGVTLHHLAPHWRDSLLVAVELLALLGRLPTLPQLVDPPSAWREGSPVSAADVPVGLLEKIRAMLAKAESTTFDAEAEAFTAKAQELMARHRIDRAVLAAASTRRDEATDGVVGRRIGVDDPYADAKATLLSQVASANGARAVWSKDLGCSTVFGFPVELDIIEELFTSLLVQATAALRREGSKRDAGGRSRTKAFRRSFLVAYAHRVGDRLAEAVERTVQEVADEVGTDLVPLLTAQDEAAEAAVEAAFPDAGTFSPSISDAEGVFAGRLAADRADLSAGPPLGRSA